MTTYILRQRGTAGEALAEALDVAAVPAPDRLREDILGDVLRDGGLRTPKERVGPPPHGCMCASRNTSPSISEAALLCCLGQFEQFFGQPAGVFD